MPQPVTHGAVQVSQTFMLYLLPRPVLAALVFWLLMFYVATIKKDPMAKPHFGRISATDKTSTTDMSLSFVFEFFWDLKNVFLALDLGDYFLVISVLSRDLIMHVPIPLPTLLSIKILMISSVWVQDKKILLIGKLLCKLGD